MKNKHIFIPIIAFCGVGALSLIASVIDYKGVNRQTCYSSRVIQFDYDGASDGKDPNGNAFDAVSFLTDDIIEDALVKSELQDKYTVKQVKTNLFISNIVPANIVDEINSYESLTKTNSTRDITSDDYHPFRYSFVLYETLDKKLSSSKLSDLCSNIVETYCDKFYNTYKMTFDKPTNDEAFSSGDCDYTYQAAIYENKLNILANYAKDIYDKHENFTYNSKKFNDIYITGQQLIKGEVSTINHIIAINALSKDLEGLKNFYTYKIETLGFDKAKYTSDLTNVNAQINSYEKDSTVYYMGPEDKIIEVENNSSKTYDTLLETSIQLADKIASIEAEIKEYQDILDDIQHASSSEDQHILIKNRLAELGRNYDALENDFIEMLNAYNEQYLLANMITKSPTYYERYSVISGSFVGRAIKIVGPSLLFTIACICGYYFFRAAKKYNKQNKQ